MASHMISVQRAYRWQCRGRVTTDRLQCANDQPTGRAENARTALHRALQLDREWRPRK
jgi:hypothetical protein